MKKYLIAFTVLILFMPALIFSDVVTFKVGLFVPRAQSDLWDIEFENMTFTKTDFQNTNFGFGYEYFLANEISVVLSIEGYNKQKSGVYPDFVGEAIEEVDYAFDYGEGFEIGHIFSVSSSPIQVSLKLTPIGRRNKFIPYVGGGIGVYLWNVRLQGDMIDFAAPEEFYDPNIDAFVFGYPVDVINAREDSKLTIGYHAFGGFMVPVANRISIEAEFKYNFAKGSLTEGFEGFMDFDLSGYQISLGVNYWF